MASLEATANRREVRKLRALWKYNRAAWEREVCERMVARCFPGIVPPLMLLDYRYWQARRCGWNAMAPALRRTGAKAESGRDVLYEPQVSPFWLWWSRLHYVSRRKIALMSKLPPSVNAFHSPGTFISNLYRNLRNQME